MAGKTGRRKNYDGSSFALASYRQKFQSETYPRFKALNSSRCILYFIFLEKSSMFRLDGKKAAVTGSGSGIGKAVAHLFAQQGAEIHVIDLNERSQQMQLQNRSGNKTEKLLPRFAM